MRIQDYGANGVLLHYGGWEARPVARGPLPRHNADAKSTVCPRELPVPIPGGVSDIICISGVSDIICISAATGTFPPKLWFCRVAILYFVDLEQVIRTDHAPTLQRYGSNCFDVAMAWSCSILRHSS